MSLNKEDSDLLVEVCDVSGKDSFTQIQFLFRAYFMPITYAFGIFANIINIIIFTRSSMRNQPVNWFFLLLSMSDLTVLIASFFVFSVPVYAEILEDIYWLRTSAYLIVWFYPIAQTGLTTSVYLTILVSVHRYLGFCHPFLIRRISNSTAVKCVILSSIVFAFAFNTTRWFELTTIPCMSAIHKTQSLVVVPTDLMVDSSYTYIYRNALYTLVMFFFPFAILIYVNLRIITTIRTSTRMRRQMTVQPRKKQDISPAHTVTLITKDSTTKTLLQSTTQSTQNQNIDRKENGITIMLVAITSEFLIFNLLAFANNILELTGAYGHSHLETLLVEVSALLVNVNGASTILIYLIFGTKYRNNFIKVSHQVISSIFDNSRSVVRTQYETTQLLESKLDLEQRTK